MGDGTDKNIEDVIEGDKVKTSDGIHSVTELDQTTLGNRFLYSFGDGNHFVTAEHPFMTKSGWKSIDPEATKDENPKLGEELVGALKEGDEIQNATGSYTKVTGISYLKEKDQPLYNFYVQGINNYYANDLLTHNKTPASIPLFNIGYYKHEYFSCPGSTTYVDPPGWWLCAIAMCQFPPVPLDHKDSNVINARNPGCHPSKVSLGDTYTLEATFWDDRFKCTPGSPNNTHPGPYKFTWINPGRGSESASDICPSSNHPWAASQLTFTNIKKSIKGPIGVECEDGNGTTHGPIWCGGFSLELPDLECPVIVSMLPRYAAKNYSVESGVDYRGTFGERDQRVCNHTSTVIFGTNIPEEIDLEFGVDAADMNPSELETGSLIYQWRINGSYSESDMMLSQDEPFATGSDRKTYSFPERWNGIVQCRVYCSNYAVTGERSTGTPTYTDPEGRDQEAPVAIATWTVNHPECEEPYLRSHKAKIQSASGYKQWSDMGGWITNVSGLGGGRERVTWHEKISVAPCSVCQIPVGYWGDWTKYANTYAPYKKYKGLTNSVTVDGSYDDMWYNPSPYRYYSNNSRQDDFVTVKKTLYLDDDGKSVSIKLSNDCGENLIKYTFEVKKTAPISMYAFPQTNSATQGRSTQYPSASSGEDYFVNYYYQEMEYFDWSTSSYSEYYKHWPTQWQQFNVTFSGLTPAYAGCRAFRIKLNGSVVRDWSHNMYPHYQSGPFRMWPSWDTHSQVALQIQTNPSRSAWPKAENIISIQTSANIPSAGNFDGGDITSFDIAVNFYKKPKITSRNTGGNGWWWCGYYNFTPMTGHPWNWWYGRQIRWNRPWCWWRSLRQTSGWTKMTHSYVRPNPNALPPGSGYKLISNI
tara:strand:- start:951 stop:3557 length:2607 start_codon:yes stop_codon:yes gene_type:complete